MTAEKEYRPGRKGAGGLCAADRHICHGRAGTIKISDLGGRVMSHFNVAVFSEQGQDIDALLEPFFRRT